MAEVEPIVAEVEEEPLLAEVEPIVAEAVHPHKMRGLNKGMVAILVVSLITYAVSLIYATQHLVEPKRGGLFIIGTAFFVAVGVNVMWPKNKPLLH